MNSPMWCSGDLPDILHRTAFNLCAALVGGAERVHWVAGNPFYAAQLSERLIRAEGRDKARRPPVLVWADPRPEAWPEIADRLQKFPPGGRVLVLAVGRSGRSWAQRDLGEGGAGWPLSPRTVVRWLAGEGFQMVARYSIGGLAYQLWGALAHAATLFRRDDWADRLHAQARAALVSDGGLMEMSRLVILVFQKRGGK